MNAIEKMTIIGAIEYFEIELTFLERLISEGAEPPSIYDEVSAMIVRLEKMKNEVVKYTKE